MTRFLYSRQLTRGRTLKVYDGPHGIVRALSSGLGTVILLERSSGDRKLDQQIRDHIRELAEGQVAA